MLVLICIANFAYLWTGSWTLGSPDHGTSDSRRQHADQPKACGQDDITSEQLFTELNDLACLNYLHTFTIKHRLFGAEYIRKQITLRNYLQ